MDVEATAALSTPDTGDAGQPPSLPHDLTEEGVTAFLQSQSSTPDSDAAATGSETPGEEHGPIPYSRFQEVNSRYRETTEQLSQLQTLQEYRNLADTLAQSGITPEQALAALASQTAPETDTPEQRFEADLAARGIDPYALTEQEYRIEQRLWDVDQRFEQLQKREEQAQLAEARTELTRQLSAVSAKYPIFADPVLGGPLSEVLQAQAYVALSNGGTIDQAAARISEMMETYKRQELARYSTAKTEDARVPVGAGGSSPPPTESVNFHRLSPSEQQAYLEAAFAAHTAPA